MVAREEREGFVEGIKRDRLADIDRHAEELYGLETELGFDLDIATDIYGLELLDPSKRSKRITSLWYDLLTKASQNPGKPLVLARKRRELKPGCYGFGQRAEYDSYVDFVACDHFDVSALRYEKGAQAPTSRITIPRPALAPLARDNVAEEAPELVLAETRDIKKLYLSSKGSMPPIIDLETTVFYDPTARQLSDYVIRADLRGHGLSALHAVQSLQAALGLPSRESES